MIPLTRYVQVTLAGNKKPWAECGRHLGNERLAQQPCSATGGVCGAPFQRFERRSLCATRHRVCAAQVLWSVIFGEVLNGLIDGAREILCRSGFGQAPAVGSENAAPVDANLPGAALVGEEDHVIVALVDMPKQPEKELERLAGDFVLSAVRGTDAFAQETLELGDEGIGCTTVWIPGGKNSSSAPQS